MIFVTVGTQLAFDRLIEAVDAWAGARKHKTIFAQIGPGAYKPRNIAYRDFISPAECRARMSSADAIVAHAGMGTILTALELGKPVLVMPRVAALGEHRNDHQLATAKRFADLGRIAVAENATELCSRLDDLNALTVHEQISPHASPELLTVLDAFIRAEPGRATHVKA